MPLDQHKRRAPVRGRARPADAASRSRAGVTLHLYKGAGG